MQVPQNTHTSNHFYFPVFVQLLVIVFTISITLYKSTYINNFSINASNNYLFIILWTSIMVLLCKLRTFFNCKHNATSMIFDIIWDCSILTSSTSNNRTQNCMTCEYPVNTLNYNILYSFNILHSMCINFC